MKLLIFLLSVAFLAHQASCFKVVGFYTAQQDLGHISFVREANPWFSNIAVRYNFTYDSTNNWSNLNEAFLSQYDVVVFLDTRPEDPGQRQAFENYMRSGRGGWLGFHFAAFALTPSAYPQNWPWYHNDFIGAGQYRRNTWKPTPAFVRVEDPSHMVVRNVPRLFQASTNEWYDWEFNLSNNPDINILLAIDESSFPLGTNPSETWRSGYFPVAWTNRNYRMLYLNMGHNDIDYDNGNADLSSTFESHDQNQLIIDALFWLGRVGK